MKHTWVFVRPGCTGADFDLMRCSQCTLEALRFELPKLERFEDCADVQVRLSRGHCPRCGQRPRPEPIP